VDRSRDTTSSTARTVPSTAHTATAATYTARATPLDAASAATLPATSPTHDRVSRKLAASCSWPPPTSTGPKYDSAARADDNRPRRGTGRRVPKSAHLEDKTITTRGHKQTLALYARDGAVGIGQLTETGELNFEEIPRVRTHRNPDKNGKYRWYNDYRLPNSLGGQTMTVRLHGTDADRARRLNRPENVRPIPPTDPDFARLYARSNDAESINRNLVDTLWLGRAHSLGHARQHLNLLGYALMVNGLALYRYQHRAPDQIAA
jgi:hypothetical protein